MTPEEWQHVKQILDSALEIAPGERATFLDEACAGDAALRLRVEALLEAHERPGNFLGKAAAKLGRKTATMTDKRVATPSASSTAGRTAPTLIRLKAKARRKTRSIIGVARVAAVVKATRKRAPGMARRAADGPIKASSEIAPGP